TAIIAPIARRGTVLEIRWPKPAWRNGAVAMPTRPSAFRGVMPYASSAPPSTTSAISRTHIRPTMPASSFRPPIHRTPPSAAPGMPLDPPEYVIPLPCPTSAVFAETFSRFSGAGRSGCDRRFATAESLLGRAFRRPAAPPAPCERRGSLGTSAEVLGEEPFHGRVVGLPVLWTGQAVPLVLEQEVLVRETLLRQRVHDLLGLGLLDPRVVGALGDQD